MVESTSCGPVPRTPRTMSATSGPVMALLSSMLVTMRSVSFSAMASRPFGVLQSPFERTIADIALLLASLVSCLEVES